MKESGKDVCLVMVGDKILSEEDLDSKIAELGVSDKIVWLRQGVPHDELWKYYALSDIYVHSSNYEGFDH